VLGAVDATIGQLYVDQHRFGAVGASDETLVQQVLQRRIKLALAQGGAPS